MPSLFSPNIIAARPPPSAGPRRTHLSNPPFFPIKFLPPLWGSKTGGNLCLSRHTSRGFFFFFKLTLGSSALPYRDPEVLPASSPSHDLGRFDSATLNPKCRFPSMPSACLTCRDPDCLNPRPPLLRLTDLRRERSQKKPTQSLNRAFNKRVSRLEAASSGCLFLSVHPL